MRWAPTGLHQAMPKAISIPTLPPGRDYLVALYSGAEGTEGPASGSTSAETLRELVDRATTVFVNGPGKYTVTLSAPKR